MRRTAAFLLSFVVFSLALLLPVPVLALGHPSECSQVVQTSLHIANDACVSVHVYDVVALRDGTRFLDLCSPDTPDESCPFSVVSYWKDSRRVGDLRPLLGKDISLRGAVRRFGAHYVLILNDQAQLHGGPAHFIPDPRLLGTTSAEDGVGSDQKELEINFHHHGKKLEKQ